MQRPGYGFGLGVAGAGISVGSRSASVVGPVLYGRVAVRRGRSTDVILEADIQPLKVENPARAEAFRSLHFLVSLQRYVAGTFYVRPGLGSQFRSWSGANPVTGSDAGGALGLSAGFDVEARPDLIVSPEVFWRGAIIELEGSVGASLTGLRVVAQWRRP